MRWEVIKTKRFVCALTCVGLILTNSCSCFAENKVTDDSEKIKTVAIVKKQKTKKEKVINGTTALILETVLAVALVYITGNMSYVNDLVFKVIQKLKPQK